MRRDAITLCLLAALAGLALGREARADPPRPNIVVMLADDLGYEGLGDGAPLDVATPHLDSIARDGMRLTTAYATSSVCAPSRAALLLGRYQQRFGFEHNPGPRRLASPEFGLPGGVETLPERLRAAGYATGAFGKWHLGFREGSRPLDRGFREFFGFLAGMHSYHPEQQWNNEPLLRGDQPVNEREYLTRAFAREAVSFIEQHAREPFFLYVPFSAVHMPLQGDPAADARVAKITNPTRRAFASMLTSLDDSVGTILAALRAHDLDARTLVFFVSDNGGPTLQTSSSNEPFSGRKGSMYEGGIRVPWLARWPGRIPSGKSYSEPVSTLDVYATALAAAGVSAPRDPPLDGVDLLPFLSGQRPGRPHERLFWRMGERAAVRSGSWKLVMERGKPDQLFDLATDRAERQNLATAQPSRARELRAVHAEWEKGMIPEKWQRGGEG